jgi:hypothetical protein
MCIINKVTSYGYVPTAKPTYWHSIHTHKTLQHAYICIRFHYNSSQTNYKAGYVWIMFCCGELGSLNPGLSTMHRTNSLLGLTGVTCFTILCAFSIEPLTVQCWIQLDSSTKFDVEFNSTCYFSVLCWLSLSSCHLVVVFKVWRLSTFWKINFNQTVGIHQNNLDHKGLKQIVVRALNRNVIDVLVSEPHFCKQGASKEGEQRSYSVHITIPYPAPHIYMCMRTQNFPRKYGIDTYF